MTNSTILILGGTGKTGRRIATTLRAQGAAVRTAARNGADVHFDWADPSTHDAALEGVGGVYLVPPALRLDFPPAVAAFLDRAQATGVHHVTALSARGVELAPAEAPARAVELDLAARDGLTHAILRPGWFMQNFDEAFFQATIATDDVIVAPTGDGAEAFVHADDIADVAVATLRDPAAHDGRGYTLTGPQALTFAEVAARISAATGRTIRHLDVTSEDFRAGAVASGMPADYADLVTGLLEQVKASANAAVTDDVERVTGHAPRDFDAYVAGVDAAAAWPAAAPVA